MHQYYYIILPICYILWTRVFTISKIDIKMKENLIKAYLEFRKKCLIICLGLIDKKSENKTRNFCECFEEKKENSSFIYSLSHSFYRFSISL